MTKTAETAPENAIESARRQQAEAAQAAEDARRLRDQVHQQIADAQAKLAEVDRQAHEAALRIAAARNAAVLAERNSMIAQRVTFEGAQLVARDLLELFSESRTKSRIENRRPFWEAIDTIRVRLMSTDVEESARPLVLAIELLIGGCDRWEQSRYRQIKGQSEPAGARGEMPCDDHRIERLEQELARELEGRLPRPLESIGYMLSTDVGPSQIAKAYGLVDASGQPEPSQVGAMVNAAFRRAGITEVPSEAIRRYGCLDLQDAWEEREKRITTGTTDRLVPGIDALPGEGRPGRGYSANGQLPDDADTSDDIG